MSIYIFLDMYIYFNIPTHGKHVRRKSQALCFWPLFCANAWRHRGHLNGSTHLSLSFGPCLSVSEASWWTQSTSWFSLGNMFDWPPAQVHVLRDTAWVSHWFSFGLHKAAAVDWGRWECQDMLQDHIRQTCDKIQGQCDSDFPILLYISIYVAYNNYNMFPRTRIPRATETEAVPSP